ncbi:MAG TPA: sulfotransferase [Halioglobus sp.]
MPTETRPNLFIVGAQKSGTSALAGWLSQHTEVLMSFPKEPGFLAFRESGYPYRDGYGKPAPASQYVIRNEPAYFKLFSHATPQQRIIAEASTWYFAIPGTARKIKTFNPEARIIVILRNPVERAYSAWCHARSDQLEPCASFAAALQLESQRGEVEFLLRYRRMGLYSQALEEYLDIFPAPQLLVLFHDDLRSDPLAMWRKVCVFLGIDHSKAPVFGRQYNRSGLPRNRFLHGVLRSHRLKRFVRDLLPHRFTIGLKQRVDNLNLQNFPVIDAASRAELKEYYRPDIQQLSLLTKRDLVAWLQ